MISNLLEWKKKVNNKITINSDSISWQNLKRSEITSLSLKNENTLFEDFTHSFEFIITEIKNQQRSNRLLVTLWKLKKSDGNIVSVYIDKFSDSTTKFRLVFYQRREGKNVFVEVSTVLDINHKYNVIIIKKDNILKIKILWEEGLIHESEELIGINHIYNEIILIQSHGFSKEPNWESSGKLFNIKFVNDNLISKEYVPEDISNEIRGLERQASNLIAKNEFNIARSIYQTIFNALKDKQYEVNRRVHLGAPLHMIGTTYILNNEPRKAFEYYLLAYITDLINTQIGEEKTAEKFPAYKMVKNFYQFDDVQLERLETQAKEYIDRRSPFEPEEFLAQYLLNGELDINKLSVLYSLPEKYHLLKNTEQGIPITESGQTTLNITTEKYSKQIFKKAFEIAAIDNRTLVTRKDVERALQELSEKGGLENEC